MEAKKKKKEKEEPKKSQTPDFKAGDIIRVHYKIKEEDKERVQLFEGVLIAQKGSGTSKTITVRKIAGAGIAVERIFQLHSPNLEKLEVVKQGKARRAKLYYLRDLPTLKSVKTR